MCAQLSKVMMSRRLDSRLNSSVSIREKKKLNKYQYFRGQHFLNKIFFFCSPKMKIHLGGQIRGCNEYSKKKEWPVYTPYQKGNLKGAPIHGILAGIIMLNAKQTILKRINVSFIVHFCFGKFSFSLDNLTGKLWLSENI